VVGVTELAIMHHRSILETAPESVVERRWWCGWAGWEPHAPVFGHTEHAAGAALCSVSEHCACTR
jgi:hypothetical protein